MNTTDLLRKTSRVCAGLLGILLLSLGTRPLLASDSIDEESVDAPPLLMSSNKADKLRRLLPKVDDSKIQRVLDDPRLILYTEVEMPKAYQDWSGQLQGVHSPSYNISANDSEPFGNGNREFPWSAPGGTHRTQGVTTFRFLWLPRDEQGHELPVVWFRKRLRGDAMQGYAWRFPVGTVVGELLILRGPDDEKYAFELRVRIREFDDWGVDAFRPFPTAADLARRVEELRPLWIFDKGLVGLVEYLAQPRDLPIHRLVDDQPFGPAFEQRMGLDVMPAIEDDALVAELLSTTEFRSAGGANWRSDEHGSVTAAPTTDAKFHIVPANYDAGFIEVDRVSCMRCHETVNHHVREFNPGRDWYGRIRGSDGIFSFHPFDPGSISHNGYGNSVRMRDELVEAGLLERYDPEKHPLDTYHSVSYLEE